MLLRYGGPMSVAAVILYGYSVMMSFLVGQATGEPGAALANFLISPSNGNAYLSLQRSGKSIRPAAPLPLHVNVTIPTSSPTSGPDVLELTQQPETTTISSSDITSPLSDTPTTAAPTAAEQDLFPEFLPMGNATADQVSSSEVGSGDGELTNGPTSPVPTFPPIERLAVTGDPPAASQVALDMTSTTLSITTSAPTSTTRGRLGFYQVRGTEQGAAVDTGVPEGAATSLSFATIFRSLNGSKLTVLGAVGTDAPDLGTLGTDAPDLGTLGTHTPDLGTIGTVTPDLGTMGTDTPDLGTQGTDQPPTGITVPQEPPMTTTDQGEPTVTMETTTRRALLLSKVVVEQPNLKVVVQPLVLPTNHSPGTEVPDPNSVVVEAHPTMPHPRESRILEGDDDLPTPAPSPVFTKKPSGYTKGAWPAYPTQGSKFVTKATTQEAPMPHSLTITGFPTRATTRRFWWTHTNAKVEPTTPIPTTTMEATTPVPTTVTEPATESTTLVTLEMQPDNTTWVTPSLNATTWHFPMLPNQRNPDQEIAAETVGHEGWVPFTIPDTSLATFLFSTLIPSMLPESTTLTPNLTIPTNGTTIQVNTTTLAPTTIPVTHVTEATEFTVVDLVTPVPSTTVEATSTEGELKTTSTSLDVVPAVANTTYPRPLVFWSDKSESGPTAAAETRKLFADDDTDGLPFMGAGATANDPHQDNGLSSLSKPNISREALDNLITVVMKYVGQPDFSFNETDKKALAELIFWPIIHESSRGHVNSVPRRPLQVVRRDVTSDGTGTTTTAAVPWPILRFMGRTPTYIDGVWVIAAYVTYKDENSTVMPRATLLTLFHDAELKLMTKMNMQLVRVFPGLPPLPFNVTDLHRLSPNDYHPLFERFSSLFIPLIVLAAICAFVAIITVVCLVKKAQRNENENKEKILRPLGVLGEENPISDEIIKHGERSRPTSSNATMPVGTSANEMYETEGWKVPMDPSHYAVSPKRVKSDEEDTKL